VNYGVKRGFFSNCLWTHPKSRGHMKLMAQGHIVKQSKRSLDRNREAPFLDRRLVIIDDHMREGD
jgi:hypothetical protein